MKISKKILVFLMILSVLFSFSISASAATTKATTKQNNTASDTAVSSESSESTSERKSEEPAEEDKTSNDSENNNNDYSFSTQTEGNADLIASEEVITDNGKFQFIAVNTRDGDVFYVIVDNSKTDNNVYFLNEVDTYDLKALLNKDDDGNAAQVGDTSVSSEDDEDEEASEESVDEEAEQTQSSESGSDSSILIIIGIVVLAGIGFVIYKIKNGGFGKFGKKKDNVELLDDEFDDEDEIEINEDKEN